jgi:outer membrane biosynthesis protein TonB
MGRLSASLLALALGVVTALGLLACGSGGDADLLPGGTASEITANLDQVEQLANEGDCAGASTAAQAVSSQIEALGGVDAKLKQALGEGATRLNEVVAACEETTSEEETVPSIELAEEPEEVEKDKPAKPEKPKPEEAKPEETDTTPSLPPQAEGEAKGHEKQEEEVPPPETGGGTPSGGVGPGEPAEGDD